MAQFFVYLSQAFRLGSTLSLGYFINDVTSWVGNVWNFLTGRSYKDSNGNPPWLLIVFVFVLGSLFITYVFNNFFPKSKSR